MFITITVLFSATSQTVATGIYHCKIGPILFIGICNYFPSELVKSHNLIVSNFFEISYKICF